MTNESYIAKTLAWEKFFAKEKAKRKKKYKIIRYTYSNLSKENIAVIEYVQD